MNNQISPWRNDGDNLIKYPYQQEMELEFYKDDNIENLVQMQITKQENMLPRSSSRDVGREKKRRLNRSKSNEINKKNGLSNTLTKTLANTLKNTLKNTVYRTEIIKQKYITPRIKSFIKVGKQKKLGKINKIQENYHHLGNRNIVSNIYLKYQHFHQYKVKKNKCNSFFTVHQNFHYNQEKSNKISVVGSVKNLMPRSAKKEPINSKTKIKSKQTSSQPNTKRMTLKTGFVYYNKSFLDFDSYNTL